MTFLELILRQEGYSARSEVVRDLHAFIKGWRVCPSCHHYDMHRLNAPADLVTCSACAHVFPDARLTTERLDDEVSTPELKPEPIEEEVP